MKKRLPTILILLVFVAGLSLLLYPTVSDWWNSFHQSRAVAAYTENVGNINDETYAKLLDDARVYNSALVDRGTERFKLSDAEVEEYNALLNLSGTGMLGYVEIPVLQTTLPVYHGTSDAVLSAGVGHLEGTSLPVGGESTHCVLSGHRGLPSAKLFSNLDKMVEGDLFLLHILDETLTYEVDQIRIVEPQEIGELAIEEGMDYCTLVTCTPYGINSHRLLVRGHRVANEAPAVRVTSDALQVEPVLVAPFAAAPILLVLLIVLLFKTRRKPRKRKTGKHYVPEGGLKIK